MKRAALFITLLAVGFGAGYMTARLRGLPLQPAALPPQDVFQLERYREANRSTHPDSVIFGDSIIELWNFQSAANRGISRQTTAQLVGRFNQDVVELEPKWVVVCGGLNDLQYQVPTSDTVANLVTLCEIAKAHHITPILLFVRACYGSWAHLSEPAESLERAIQDAALRYHLTFIPIRLISDESDDGLHPNQTGYDKVSRAVLTVLERSS